MKPATGTDGARGGDEEIRLLDFWETFSARRAVFFTVLAVVVGVVAVVSLLTTPQYTATTTLEIERRGPDILTFREVMSVDPSYSARIEFFQTQYQILASRAVRRLAVERIDLPNRPEYATRSVSPIRRFTGWLAGLLPEGEEETVEEPRDPVDAAADFIAGRLEILPVRDSLLVVISFTDSDAQLATDIANAVADAYLQFQLDVRYDTTGKATEFLIKDVAHVQAEIGELQRELQAYGEENEILSLSDGTQDISEQALADINRRYTEARVFLASAEARLEAVRDTPPEGLPEVLESPTIGDLRRQHSDLEREQAQLSERFNHGWPALAELRGEVRKTEEQLKLEAERITMQVRAVAASDFAEALAEVRNLERQREQQKGEVQRVQLDAIEYTYLKEEIAAKQLVLNDLVSRQGETEASFRLRGTSTSNIRVLEAAELPKGPSSPRTKFNLAVALLVGTLLGLASVFVVDHLDNSIKTEHDVQRISALGILGHVPLTRPIRVVGDAAQDERPSTRLDLASHVAPRSSLAEAFRNLRTSLLLAVPDQPPRYIAVTSCEPSDGKSTVAANLAIVLTQLGRRVLLVDADLRRPRLHVSFHGDNSVGLSNLLSGNATPDEIIVDTDIPQLSILPSGPLPPNPSELLGSPRLTALLEDAQHQQRFDHIIFDTPPLVSVTDPIVLAAQVDATVVVVRAGATSRGALQQCTEKLRNCHASVVGVVLNAVAEGRGYYGTYYHHYSSYHSDGQTTERATLRDLAKRVRKQAG